MRIFRGLGVCVWLLVATRGAAQTPASTPEPPLRRWFEFQTVTLGARYRFIESNRDRVTSNDLQYREQIRARFNFDAKRRYTVTAGAQSGSSFASGWDYSGAGINDADYHNHYLRQLFLSAAPVAGLELQYGGFYVTRGENSEIPSFDDDGYVMGARASLRRPKTLYFDEITVTRAKLGPANAPNIHQRWKSLDDPDYTQVLVAKRFSPVVSASLDYADHAGADTVRAALFFRFRPNRYLTSLRYEQYHRFNAHEADGMAITAERPITKWVRLQGGFGSVDEFYGPWNGDRYVIGNRIFAIATLRAFGPLTPSLFFTQAFDASYPIPIRTRFDAILSWDVLNTLRKTGKF